MPFAGGGGRPKKSAELSRAEAGPVRPASAPTPSVRVRAEVLDRFLSSVGEVVLSSRQVRTAAETGSRRASGPALGPASGPASGAAGGVSRPGASGVSAGLDRMERAVGELQRRALALRTAPLLRVMDTLPRLARDVAGRCGKRVEVELHGAELELDRAILDRLGDPLVHLVRNAVDHGIENLEERRHAGKPESGVIVVDARRERDSIRISVSDDGAGIDLDAVRARAVAEGWLLPDLADDLPPEEIAALVFRPGLSTRETVSDISGRGVGMDAVKATIESLGGWLELHTERGRGTTTVFGVPITAAVQRVLLLGLDGETVAIPIAKVERIVEVPEHAIECAGREAFALVDDEPVPVIDLAARLGLPGGTPRGSALLVLAEVRGARVGLRVERLAGQEEIYVKPVPRLLACARVLAGLTVLGDGTPVFALDLNQLA